MRLGIVLSVFCMVGLSIVLSSCTNESKQKVSSREGIVDWISEIIAKNETDSLNPDKSTLEVSIEYLAVSKIDSSKSYFYDCGIISYPDNGTFSKLGSDTPSYEEHQYNILPNDLYLAGGFSHEPDTVIMRDIHIGIEPIRDPISALCKKGYANYWQLKGEWPVSRRFFYSMWNFVYQSIPTDEIYLALATTNYVKNGIAQKWRAYYFIDSAGQIVELAKPMPFNELMQQLNKDYWYTIYSQQNPIERERYKDALIPIGDYSAIDRNGNEYKLNPESLEIESIVDYGESIGQLR